MVYAFPKKGQARRRVRDISQHIDLVVFLRLEIRWSIFRLQAVGLIQAGMNSKLKELIPVHHARGLDVFRLTYWYLKKTARTSSIEAVRFCGMRLSYTARSYSVLSGDIKTNLPAKFGERD